MRRAFLQNKPLVFTTLLADICYGFLKYPKIENWFYLYAEYPAKQETRSKFVLLVLFFKPFD